MPNYSELYSLPSASALSLPHYNSVPINYYSKPISRYPGVYKPHLTTISEIISPYRRLNTPKLNYPSDISSRPIKPIKVFNTADIDVSVNKYKKYEKKTPRLKPIEPKPIEPKYIEPKPIEPKHVETKPVAQEQPPDVVAESKPKPAIRRDRATIRIRTVHADTVKQEIGAFKTWRDNFEPNELVNEVKTRKKTKGEILKEKFLIRCRSKENIPGSVDTGKKNLVKKTSSFRDICTAITSENISDELNPGQPEAVQRRQSRQLSSENLLKDIRRVSTELSQDDLNLLSTILSSQEDTCESSDESLVSVKLPGARSDNVISSDNNNAENECKADIQTVLPIIEDTKTKTEDSKKKVLVKKHNLSKAKSDDKIKETNLKTSDLLKSKSEVTVIEKKKEDVSKCTTSAPKKVIKKHSTESNHKSVAESDKESETKQTSAVKVATKPIEDNETSSKAAQKIQVNNKSITKQEEVPEKKQILGLKSSTKPTDEIKINLNSVQKVPLLKENKTESEQDKDSNSKCRSGFGSSALDKKSTQPNPYTAQNDSPTPKFAVKKNQDSIADNLKLKDQPLEESKSISKININQNRIEALKQEIKEAKKAIKDVDKVDTTKKPPTSVAGSTGTKKEETQNKVTAPSLQPTKSEEIKTISENSPKEQSIKDISNVEIQQIKFKTKPIITASVEDINIPKKTLKAVVNNVEVEKPVKMEKKFKLNVTVNVEPKKEKKKKENLNRVSIKEGTVVHPMTKKCVENVIVPKKNNKENCKKLKELTPVKKVKKKKDHAQDTNVMKSPGLDDVPEDSVVVETPKENAQTPAVAVDENGAATSENISNKMEETKPAEEPPTLPKRASVKITSKRSLLKKPTKDDPDLVVFVPPPEPEPEPEVEEKKDVFVPLQSNRLSNWMHPWAKPEQFDECPVEIFARPKIIRGRHYPRPRKRNGNVPVVENESSDSDSDDENTSTEDTSASLRSNDSGFGSTIPEKLGVSQRETTNEEGEPSEDQTSAGVFVPPEGGKIIPPATTLPRFRKYCVEDFDFLKVLGKGSFGKVLLSKLKETDYYYAVKCLKKDVIVEDDDVECTLIERKVLALGTRHPFLCHLLCTFQTQSHLFFVMEYLNGGDLMFHITNGGSFPEEQAQFYSAEIISGLQFLHSKGIIYRDLKLDNVLLDFDGHARLADFGMCQLQIFLDRMAESFCGTPDYMAPEIIKGQHYNQAVDWWSFGVLLYEMFLGQSPFSGCDEDELFWSICNEKPVFPKHLSTYAVDILTLLLEKDQSKRLGNRFCPHGPIRDHNFYRHLDWRALEARQVEPPFKPNLRHPLDTQYFDTHFTKEAVKLTPTEVQMLETIDQSQFQGFSYTNPNATDK